jgi:hypothetical protein
MGRVPGIAGELGEEGALGVLVALLERVQGVHIGEQRGEDLDEGRSLETPEMTSPGGSLYDRLPPLGQVSRTTSSPA